MSEGRAGLHAFASLPQADRSFDLGSRTREAVSPIVNPAIRAIGNAYRCKTQSQRIVWVSSAFRIGVRAVVKIVLRLSAALRQELRKDTEHQIILKGPNVSLQW